MENHWDDIERLKKEILNKKNWDSFLTKRDEFFRSREQTSLQLRKVKKTGNAKDLQSKSKHNKELENFNTLYEMLEVLPEEYYLYRVTYEKLKLDSQKFIFKFINSEFNNPFV